MGGECLEMFEPPWVTLAGAGAGTPDTPVSFRRPCMTLKRTTNRPLESSQDGGERQKKNREEVVRARRGYSLTLTDLSGQTTKSSFHEKVRSINISSHFTNIALHERGCLHLIPDGCLQCEMFSSPRRVVA